jgi:hypothetical protein
MARPYPDPARALRQVQRTRAVYRYGRVPQRYVMGLDRPELVATLVDVFGSVRPDFGPTAASLDDLPRGSRRRRVVVPTP